MTYIVTPKRLREDTAKARAYYEFEPKFKNAKILEVYSLLMNDQNFGGYKDDLVELLSIIFGVKIELPEFPCISPAVMVFNDELILICGVDRRGDTKKIDLETGEVTGTYISVERAIKDGYARFATDDEIDALVKKLYNM